MLSQFDPIRGPVDVTWQQVRDYVLSRTDLGQLPEPFDDPEILERTCRALVRWAGLGGFRGSGSGGQVMHETAVLRFPGDVDPGQFNFAGLGATGGGVKGAEFDTPEDGIQAWAEHLAVYVYGPRGNWPRQLLDAIDGRFLDPRYTNVLSAGTAGKVQTWDRLGGTWSARYGTYGLGVERHANAILSIPAKGDDTAVLKIAIGAGHHNTQGGNPVEQDIVEEIVELEWKYFNSVPGVEARSITPDGPDPDDLPGDGYTDQGIFESWKNALDNWARTGWVPDLIVEEHTQGTGNPAACGFFGVYPSMAGDVDVDARDRLIPFVCRRVDERTPLGIWSNGVMPEHSTNVGSQGYRLAVFSATTHLRMTAERVLFENGAHTCPRDLELLRDAGFIDLLARTKVAAILDWYEVAHDLDGAPVPPEKPEILFHQTGKKVVKGFFGRTKELIEAGFFYHHVGFPITDEFNITMPDGTTRAAQIFQKDVWTWNPQAPQDWQIQSVLDDERDYIVAYAKLKGIDFYDGK